MITSLTIENFKGFQKLKADNLTRINLFGGSNNIGKTSILEAIFAYYDRLSPDFYIKELAWRGLVLLSAQNQKEHELWAPLFHNYDITKSIKLSITIDKNHYEDLEIKIDKDFSRSIGTQSVTLSPDTTPSQSNSSNQFALHLVGNSNHEKSLDTSYFFSGNKLQMVRKVIKVKNILGVHYISYRTTNSKQDSVRFGKLISDNKDSLVVKALKIIEPRLTEISAIPISENLTVLHGNIGLPKKVPINYLGDGVTKVLSYVLAIVSNPKSIILIDEIENGIHYTKHNEIWELLFSLAEEYDVQIFANTHSYEMVKAYNNTCVNLNKNYSYLELFHHIKNQSVMSNYLDKDTLLYKIENGKPFRGE
jgi:AAA15 family ATPase/GTPase